MTLVPARKRGGWVLYSTRLGAVKTKWGLNFKYCHLGLRVGDTAADRIGRRRGVEQYVPYLAIILQLTGGG